MTDESVLLVLGAALMLVAALAGRPRARAIGLARGPALRGALAAAGALCVVAAVILRGSDERDVPAGAVTVEITDELGSGQLSERIRVFLDGRDVGVVTVDERAPKARLSVTVPKAGRFAYRLQSTRQVNGRQPTRVDTTGNVVIDGHSSRLDVFSDDEGKTYLVPR
ncbi:MAG: hypothetical protein QOJ89_3502 [bacterium]|jgi:hypothetical protein